MNIKGKKICFFLGAMKLGGIGKTSLNLMGDFVEKGILVDLYLTHYVGEYLDQIPNGVNVVVGEGNYFKRFVFFASYLLKSKPDVVISARDSLNLFNIFCSSIFSSKSVKVVTLRTNQTIENLYLKKKSSKITSYLYKIAYRKADKIIAVSEGVAKDFHDRFKIDRVKVIYNPVYKEIKQDEEWVLKSSLKNLSDPDFKYILGVGRLKKQKDFKTLILAFKKASDFIGDISLVILGEGEERESLESLIHELGLKERVFLLGFVDNPQQYMLRAEIFVLSSLWEGFGNVLVDALGAGCKIISTDCPSGPNEILQDGKYGELVKPNNEQELFEAIIKMTRFNEDKSHLINRAKEFSIGSISRQYLDYIFDDKL